MKRFKVHLQYFWHMGCVIIRDNASPDFRFFPQFSQLLLQESLHSHCPPFKLCDLLLLYEWTRMSRKVIFVLRVRESGEDNNWTGIIHAYSPQSNDQQSEVLQ